MLQYLRITFAAQDHEANTFRTYPVALEVSHPALGHGLHFDHPIKVKDKLGGHSLWSDFPHRRFRSHVPSLCCGFQKAEANFAVEIVQSILRT